MKECWVYFRRRASVFLPGVLLAPDEKYGYTFSVEPDKHSQHLTEREQKILFQRWEDQQKQEAAEQSEPTVKDIAEAYGMPPEEVARQLAAVRSEEAMRADAARQRAANARRTVRGGITALVLGGLGWVAVTHLSAIHWSGMAASAAAKHDRQGARDLDAKNYADAEREETLAVQQQPNDAVYRVNLGNALFSQKKYAEALPQYQAAVRLKPGSAKYEQYVADTLLDLNRFPEAAAAYRSALALDPSSLDSETGLGESLAKQGQNADAETVYRAALRLSPNNTDVLDGLGAALGQQHRITEAAGYFRQAVTLAPGNAEYRSNLDLAEKKLREGQK